jgi:uncharacterized protein YcfJ
MKYCPNNILRGGEMKKMRVYFFVLLISLSLSFSTFAELVIYPSKGQSKEQISKDKGICRDWAIKETGVDPDKLASESTNVQSRKDHKMAKGAASGALVGGAAGSFSGDFGKGAAIGAVVGAITGGLSKGRDKKRAEEQTKANEAKKKEKMNKFNKAYSACLEAKGYNVK